MFIMSKGKLYLADWFCLSVLIFVESAIGFFCLTCKTSVIMCMVYIGILYMNCFSL